MSATANATAGSYSVTATAAGVSTGVNYTLTNNAGSAKTITATGGSGQSIGVSDPFGSSLVATVTDANNNPVSGVLVIFAGPSSGASATLSPNTATTNASGQVTVSATANPTVGSYTVTATANGVSTGASYTLTNTAGAPKTITATSGSFQSTGVATGFASSLVATVTDANNNPVSGVSVTFAGPSNGASATFSPTTATTNASGQVTVSATANATIGSYLVTATAAGVSTGATYSLTNTIGPPKTITATSGSGQTNVILGTFGNFLFATVTDAGNNPLSGVSVTFAGPASGASATFIPSPNQTTNSLGQVFVAATANSTAGSYSVSATAAGVSTPALFALTNTAGAVQSLTATSGSGQSALVNNTFGTALVVTAKDGFNNTVSGATVAFSAPASGASATFNPATTQQTNAQGQVTVTAIANATAGTYTLTAQTIGGFSQSTNFTLTNTAGSAKNIAAGGGSGQSAQITAQFTTPLVATVTDVGNNPVSGVVVTFAGPSSGASATFSPTTATTNASGQVTVSATANTSTGTYSVSATTAGVLTPATFTLTNTAGGPKTITATSGTGQSTTVTNNFGSSLVATVTDAGNNPVSGVTVTFSAPSSGASATFSPTTATTNASGQVTITATANTTAGTYSVTATANGVSTGATYTLTNTAGTAKTVTATSGSGQSVALNTAFANPLVATVTDTNNNPVSGVSVTFTAPSSGAGATFNPTTGTTNAAGQVTVTATANTTSGTYSVSATAAGVLTPATFTLINKAGAPTLITATSGSGQSAGLNASFANALVATVTDASSNPVSGVTVTFAGPAGGQGATFSPTTATTNATGQVTVTATANATLGSYSVSATAAGVSTPATYSLTNIAGGPAAIAATSGSGQSQTVGMAFATPLTATVTDIGNNPVSGVTVTFAAPSSNASATLSSTTATTNSLGKATVTATANTKAGSYIVQATVNGATSPAQFSLINKAGSPASVAASAGSGQSALINNSFTTALQATVTDANGNAVSGVTVTFTAPGTGSASGTFAGGVSTATANTNGLGVATAPTFTADGVAGSFQMTASVSGVSSPASYSLTNTAAQSGGITVTSASVGQNLEAAVTIQLPQASASYVTVTLTSSDPTKAFVAVRNTDAGAGSVNINIPPGLTAAGVMVQGLVSSGSVTLTASAVGYPSGTSTVTLTPSAFVLAGPNGIGVPSFTINEGLTTSMAVYPAQLDPSFNYVQTSQVRGGVTVSVPLSSTNTNVGTIAASQVTFNGGDSVYTLNFNAVATGSTTITAAVPTGYTYTYTCNTPQPGSVCTSNITGGFTTPSNGYNNVTASVNPLGLVANNTTVGNGLESSTYVTLNGVAPPQGLQLTVTSNNPGQMLLSPTGTDSGDAQSPYLLPPGGASSITISIPGGSVRSPYFYVYGLANTGTVTYTATAAGFGSATGTVTLAPSAVVIAGPYGLGVPIPTTSGAGPTTLTITSAVLDSSGNYVGAQPVAGGRTVSVNVSGTPQAGTLTPSTLAIPQGTTTATTQFQPTNAANTVISVSEPSPFVTPTQYSTITINVNTPGMSITDQDTIGQNLQDQGNVGLGQFSATDTLVTITSGNSNLLMLSTSPTGPALPSIQITIPAGTLRGTYYMHVYGNSGQVTYTASANGYVSRTATVNMGPSGVVLIGPFGAGYTFFFEHVSSGPAPFTVGTALLNSDNSFNLMQPVAAGAPTVSVNLTSSNVGVGTITSPITLTAGVSSLTSTFTPQPGGGSTSVFVSGVTGSTQASNNQSVSVTVYYP